MTALSPDHTVTLTTKGQTEFCEVFDLPRYNTKDMASGPSPSGVQLVTQDDFEFTWFPAPHPIVYAASQVYNRLETDFDTRDYFDSQVEDIFNYMLLAYYSMIKNAEVSSWKICLHSFLDIN